MRELLRLERVSKFYGKKQVLGDINLSILEGSITGIVGETGCGKTTLAKIIIGIEEMDQGEMYFNGGRLLPFKKRRFVQCAQIQYIFQNPYSSLQNQFTVEEVLEETTRLCEKGGLKDRMNPKEALSAIGINNYDLWKNKKVATLSGGERQKICLARAIITKPKLIIADEATSMLDSMSSVEVLDTLKKIREDYDTAMLIISHQFNVLNHICEDLYILKDGQFVEGGNTKEILKEPSTDYGKALVSSINLFMEK